ncbi:hypothetical protein ACQP2E_15835 [Actinoplanes sp. CA-015351]
MDCDVLWELVETARAEVGIDSECMARLLLRRRFHRILCPWDTAVG